MHWLSAFLVFLGSWLSGFFIIATDAWMQHPVGYKLGPGGDILLDSFWALILNPWTLWQYLHNMIAAVVTASFAMASIGAYYLLAGKHQDHARIFVRTGLVAGTVALLSLVFPTGDGQGRMIAEHQPVTLAAMEGLFETEAGAVDWYTVLVGAAALTALAMHGCYWVVLKASGDLQTRSRAFASRAWWAVAALTLLVAFFSFRLQANIAKEFADRPWGFIFPLLALAGLAGMRVWGKRQRDLAALLSSCLYLAGMLTSAAFGLFPYVLPSNSSSAASLTVTNAAAPSYGLWVGLWWWIPGMALAAVYSIFVYRHFAGKVES